MKQDKLIYLIFGTYLISFLLLVFDYSSSNTILSTQLNLVQKELGISSIKLTILVFLISVIYSIIVLLIYYKVCEFVALKFDESQNYNNEMLLVSIMISESICYITALFLFGFVDLYIMKLVIPVLGLTILALLLRGKYSLKYTLVVLAVRFFFYLTNFFIFI